MQDEYNKQHGITPKTVTHNVRNTLEITKKAEDVSDPKNMTKTLEKLTKEMKAAANELDFERAIKLREEVTKLRKKLDGLKKS